MAQRTFMPLHQGGNTIWNIPAATTTYYGCIQGPFFLDAGFTNATGTASGGYGECAFACVLSKVHQTIAAVSVGQGQLTARVNVQGLIAASSSIDAGAGNQSATTPNTPAIANPTYWYDATDIDAITAGQTIGLMQTLTAGTLGGPVNPSLGVVCDSVNQGFSSPFIFPAAGIGSALQYIGATTYSHLAGLSGSSGSTGAGFTSTIGQTQDYMPGAFVASWLQWQTTAANADAGATSTATFTSSATAGALTASSLAATKQAGTGAMVVHDTTDISAVPAGQYCNLQWSGATSGGHLFVGNASATIRPAGNNATFLLTGCSSASGVTWAGGTGVGDQFVNTTFTMFGVVRNDQKGTENVAEVPTAGVFSGLAFQSGANTYGGTPATFSVLRGQKSGESIVGNQGNGTISTNNFANFFPATSLSVTSTAASAWSFDTTDIAAFAAFDGLLMAIASAANGSTGSVAFRGYSINFTAPAHLGLTTMGAG